MSPFKRKQGLLSQTILGQAPQFFLQTNRSRGGGGLQIQSSTNLTPKQPLQSKTSPHPKLMLWLNWVRTPSARTVICGQLNRISISDSKVNFILFCSPCRYPMFPFDHLVFVHYEYCAKNLCTHIYVCIHRGANRYHSQKIYIYM